MTARRWRPRHAAVVGAVAAVAVVYFLFDPLESPYMPQCLFRRLTGLSCPGCGSQRVAHALLPGDLAGAFRVARDAAAAAPGALHARLFGGDDSHRGRHSHFMVGDKEYFWHLGAFVVILHKIII